MQHDRHYLPCQTDLKHCLKHLTMDQKTVAAYNRSAKKIAQLHENLLPSRLYQLIKRFFIDGEKSLDVGCGIGRDTHWLQQQGYQTSGLDAAQKMLFEARERYPNQRFICDNLPLLAAIKDNYFNNLLCSAVIMHLPENQVSLAIKNLLRVTMPGGVLVLSFRRTNSINMRENHKLYTSLSVEKLTADFRKNGAVLLFYKKEHESGRGIDWHNLVFKKLP